MCTAVYAYAEVAQHTILQESFVLSSTISLYLNMFLPLFQEPLVLSTLCITYRFSFLSLLPSSLYGLCWTRISYLYRPAGVFMNTITFSNFCGTCVEREGARARESERASERERQSERESARESESEIARERENEARERVRA